MRYVPVASPWFVARHLAVASLADGSFVRIADAHLDVPLFWQCWKLDSPMIDAVTDAVRSAASDLRRPRR
jgi:LysR family transcriptional regulator (chromosome initiation inhibitor)